ncbi:MAG: hypothetical protein ABI347_01875 [Nitrososphaera sp.]
MSDSSVLPAAAAGLAAGILLIAIFAAWMGNNLLLPPTATSTPRQHVSRVTILQDADVQNSGSSRAFDPPVITVVIGVNNTVMWKAEGAGIYWIEPDKNDDPGFVAATKGVLISRDHSFQYTFTKEGKFGYHSRPWMMGEVDVLPAR